MNINSEYRDFYAVFLNISLPSIYYGTSSNISPAPDVWEGGGGKGSGPNGHNF